MTDKLMSTEEVAELLGVSSRQVRNLAQEGTLRYELVGRTYVFFRSDVEKLARQRIEEQQRKLEERRSLLSDEEIMSAPAPLAALAAA